MRKKNIISALLIVLCLSACGREGASDSGQSNSSENEVAINQEVIADENETDNFVSDCTEAEKNTMGSTSANVTTCGIGGKTRGGKVTGQGKWAYYFYDGQIKKIDEEGNIYSLCYATKAHSLNVIGDFIYYLSEGTIYKVRTDGAMQEEIITNIDNNNSFIMVENSIYYIGASQVSASMYEYTISKYDLDTKNIMHYPVNMGTVQPILSGYYDNKLYCSFDIEGMSKWVQIDTITSEITEFDLETRSGIVDGNSLIYSYWSIANALNGKRAFHLTTYDLGNKGEIVKQIDTNTGTDVFFLKNIYKDNYIMSTGTQLLCIPMTEINESEILGYDIVEEHDSIETAYVVGEYIYYELESDNSSYDTRPMYRIKIDGTNWSAL